MELCHSDSDETSTVLGDALLTTLNNSFEHECLEEAVALLGATSRPDAQDDVIRGTKYLLKAFPSVTFLAHQIWGIWFLVRRWLFDVDLPGVLLADEMGLGKTYTVLAAALFAKTIAHSLMTRQDCPLLVFFGRTLRQWQDEVEQGFPGLSEAQRGWYPCTHPRPVPRRLLQLLLDQGEATQDVAPWHPVLCVVLPSVRETFLAATRTITSGTRFAVRDLSGDGGWELGHTHLNFSMSHPKRMWDIHVITYNAFTQRAQRNPSGRPRQLTDCTWSWGIFDESHRYKGPQSIGWRVAMKAEIGFKVQVTATPAYHSLRDWANLSRWLLAIPHEVEVAESVSRHGPVALGKAVANVQRAVSKALPPDEQQAAAAEMIEVARPWTIRRWTESKLESGAPLVPIPAEIVHQVPLEWTPEEQERLAGVVKRLHEQTLTDLRGVAWRVHRWQLACFSFPLEEEGDHQEGDRHEGVDYKWREEWDAANFVEGPVFRWLRGFMGDLMTMDATIPLLDDRQQHSSDPVRSPLPQKAVIFCPLPGEVRHVRWWLRQNFGQVKVVQMLSEDSSDKRQELMEEFQVSTCGAI